MDKLIHLPIRFYRKATSFIRSKRLNKHDFTVISNNCIAGVIYHAMGIKFNTPTINIFFKNPHDFIKYVANLKTYATSELVELDNEAIAYPVGLLKSELGDIELHFMHYNSFSEAKSKWQERSKRIKYDSIYVIMELGNNADEGLLSEFESLKFENKVVFTDGKYNSRSSYFLDIYDENYYPGKILSYKSKTSSRRYLDDFDYISFINTGIINGANRI